ncbi:hypothetical protein Aperf_G00000005379 [Anoplocephala perfoliata]
MSGFDAEVYYFDKILHQIKSDEEYFEHLYRIIQTGLIDSVKKVPLPIEEKPEEEIDVSEKIVSEIENALSKAQIAYEESMKSVFVNNSALNKAKQKAKSGAKQREASSLKGSRESKMQSRIPKDASKCNRNKSSLISSANHSRHGVIKSEAAVLRKRAKSWLPSKSFDTRPEYGGIVTQTPSTLKEIDSSSYLYHLNPKNSSPPSTLELDENTLQRVNDVIALSKSLDKYSEETLQSLKDSTAQKDFLAYCDSLKNLDECDLDIYRRFFAHNLPKLITLFDQFMKIMDVVDWKIATLNQHQWRGSLLGNFAALFNIADSFRPLLLDDSAVSNGSVVSESPKDSFPSMETLWNAYVCTGQNLPSSYSDPPIDVPSRGCRLTLGPAVFPNNSRSHQDFEEMLDLWSDVFHLQKRLQILDFFEKRLPQWLESIAHQPSERASTLRLLCQIACDCFPVTVDNE